MHSHMNVKTAYILRCFTAENAAVCIQRMWRGYQTRNLNRRVMAAYRDIQASRTQEYIQWVYLKP